VSVAKGYGKLDSSSGEGKLKVSFFRPFWARYWVIALDAEYRWSLVGEPQRKYLWIRSRTPGLQAAALETIEGHATRQGFEWAQLIWTPKS
jgi:apolipoprotein D and lipocalin family protein